ncbi:hypothetical protein Tcan_18059 [Toxocara canis]|uniref:Uncharacterized protein n=1 Tax=Toxocara canis TaxID=6265 RepID=A0A0B2V1T7_TOXCA|nr:hypothetical protein Tcan_18059 [Toxocara canis]
MTLIITEQLLIRRRIVKSTKAPNGEGSMEAQTVASECAASGTLSSDANEDSVGGGYDIMSGLEKAIIDLSMLGLSDGDSTDINAKLN